MDRAPGALVRHGRSPDDGRWFDPHDAARHSHAWRTPIPWPVRVGVLPAEARCHQHRAVSAPLDQPRDWNRETATTGPVHLVTGPSGVGKTQLVAHYVRTLWDAGDVDLLIWITAASREAILSAYAEAAEIADRGSSALPGAEARARHFLNWARDTHKRWIVVFDDLADAAHLEGLWPTGNPNGRVITTATTVPELPEAPIAIELGGFGEVEAYEFLATSLLHEPELLDEADQLAADLDRLPLALGQAAAYIRDQSITCADYRKRLANADVTHGVVGATSELCAELADDLVPDSIARMLRHLLAYLDGRGFPAAVCVQPVVLHHLGRFAGRPVSAGDVTGALDQLQRLGLLTRDAEFAQIAGPTREAVFARIPAEAHWTVAHVVAEALTTAWPQGDHDDALTRSLRDNATGLRERAGEMLWTPDCHLLLLRLGDSLGTAGFASAATVHFGEMARLALRHLGPDHPRTLASRYRHAGWCGEAGDPAGAAEGFALLLNDRLRTLGPDHPETLDAWTQLALWQARGGDTDGAVENLTVLFEQHARVFGAEHLETLKAGERLAELLGNAQGPDAAVRVLAPLVVAASRTLGPHHPNTLAARHDLANWHGLGGHAAAAVGSLTALLELRERLLGDGHPDTLLTRHDLLNWQGVSGGSALAAEGYAGLVADAKYVLGTGHPQTVAAGECLGYWGE
ncbi:tetratricopeptide repeat protein [Phytomonospora endophytica]|uniref:Tetratricopeptide repeat protein n=1 Tax=Phytomonospora endophytica TaxID=714109 RepID=A0A841FZD1_9ACTN|nr:tetratricopeptide repeat protein [Phytomonospora endophytica]MBB6039068.1 hypothetical protein [Phytomonospora endophytica]GIG63706.1 hypothetical protein Pen01_00010 [Phytomonospora endophytica]